MTLASSVTVTLKPRTQLEEQKIEGPEQDSKGQPDNTDAAI